METKRFIRIGIILVLGFGILIWGINYLKGIDLFRTTNSYYAVYERVDGLSASSPVIVNGFKIGQVRAISFSPNRTGELVVEIAIEKEFELPKVSTARIISSDIIGTKAIQLIYGQSGVFHSDGDTLIADIERDLMEEVNMQILPIKNKAESLMLSFDSVLIALRSIFNENTRDNLKKSFESIKTAIANLEHTTYTVDNFVSQENKRLTAILDNVHLISENLKQNNEAITAIINNFSAISDSIARSDIKSTINNTNDVLAKVNDIVDKVNNGEGALGQLLHNDTLYYNLENATYNFNRLLRDVRENPKRYVHFSAVDMGTTINVSDEEDKRVQRAKRENKDKKFMRDKKDKDAETEEE